MQDSTPQKGHSDGYLTAKEVAERYGCSIPTVHYRARNNHLPQPHLLTPYKARWSIAELDAWDAEHGKPLTDLTGYLTVKQVAERYGAHPPQIYKWKNAGKLPPPHRLAPKVSRWSIAELDEWDARREGGE